MAMYSAIQEPMSKRFQFNRQKFTQELLALGIGGLDEKAAKKVGREIEQHLKASSIAEVNAETISHLVRFKLQELGLMEAPKLNKTKVTRIPQLKGKAPLKKIRPSLIDDEPASYSPSENFDDDITIMMPVAKNTPGNLVNLFEPDTVAFNTAETFETNPTIDKVTAPAAAVPRLEISLPDAGRIFLEQAFSTANTKIDVSELFERLMPANDGVQLYNLMASGEFLPHPSVLAAAVHGKNFQFPQVLWLNLAGDLQSAMSNTSQIGEWLSLGVQLNLALNLKAGQLQSHNLAWLKIFTAMLPVYTHSGARHLAWMKIDHPEIEQLLAAYDQVDQSNLDLGFTLTSDFLQAVAADTFYALKDPQNLTNVKMLAARKVYETLLDLSANGKNITLLFEDNFNPHLLNKLANADKNHLSILQSLKLGAINLATMVEQQDIAWPKLKRVLHSAVNFYHNNNNAISHLDNSTQTLQGFSLCPVGIADMLAQMEIPFASSGAQEKIEAILRFMRLEILDAYHLVSSEKPQTGILAIYDHPMWRNILRVEGGALPFSSLTFSEVAVSGDAELYSIHPILAKACYKHGVFSDELINELPTTNSLQKCDQLSEEVKECFVTWQDLNPADQLEILSWYAADSDLVLNASFHHLPQDAIGLKKFYSSIYAKKIDQVKLVASFASTSETPTLEEDFEEATVVAASEASLDEIDSNVEVSAPDAPIIYERPEQLSGSTQKFCSTHEELYVTLNSHEGSLKEILLTSNQLVDKLGPASLYALGQLMNLALEQGVVFGDIMARLEKITAMAAEQAQLSGIYLLVDSLKKAYTQSQLAEMTDDFTDEFESAAS